MKRGSHMGILYVEKWCFYETRELQYNTWEFHLGLRIPAYFLYSNFWLRIPGNSRVTPPWLPRELPRRIPVWLPWDFYMLLPPMVLHQYVPCS